MGLCHSCFLHGYCARLKAPLVSDAELADPAFILDVREAAAAQDIHPDHWLEHVSDLYRDYLGRIVDASGQEIFLDMDALEAPHIRSWFRDFIRPRSVEPSIRIRSESRERVRIIATLLRAHDPKAAALWGVRAANDNAP